MSYPTQNRQIVLRERPTAAINPSLQNGTFELKTASVPSADSLPSNTLLIKVIYASLDPAMRGWLRDARSYLPPVQIGEVMRSAGLGKVIAVGKDNKSSVQVGDYVSATTGWQEYAIVKSSQVSKLDLSIPGVRPLDFLGPLGSSGQTAYWGMMDVAELKGHKDEVVVVTGAAGSVGTVAVQMAKLKGSKVIAVAGGKDKCDWLKNELRVDEAIDYKAEGFSKTYRETLKRYGYIDVLFENVGGEMLDTALLNLKPKARIALCGAISAYNVDGKPVGLQNYQALIAMKAKLQGFIVFEYAARYHEAEKVIGAWLAEGKMKRYFHEGAPNLEGLPQALVDLFAGVNKGKMYGKIASE